MGVFARRFLKTLGALEIAQLVKKRFVYTEHAFMPCTPHLLIAINETLRWYAKRGLAEPSEYLEFGVFRGFSLWYAQAFAQTLGIQNMRWFGFDSFLGLPKTVGKDAGGEFKEGAYCSSRKEVETWLTQYGADWSKTFLVEGWFDKTLTPETRKKHNLKRCSICVVDCDLYESTRQVLDFVEPLIYNESVILFDDWNSFSKDPKKGERGAFADFLAYNPSLLANSFIEFGGHGKGFVMKRRG